MIVIFAYTFDTAMYEIEMEIQNDWASVSNLKNLADNLGRFCKERDVVPEFFAIKNEGCTCDMCEAERRLLDDD